ncbi:ATP-dependent helicase, partial [Streptomyces sp. SID6648]|nr:ATP-dependent helicase [Streptomyces sp. SID6648]
MTEQTGEGEARTADVARLLRHPAVFLPGPVPREGRIAFWDPHDPHTGGGSHADGDPWRPDPAPERAGTPFAYADATARPDTVPYTSARLTVVRPDDATGPGGVRTAEVPAALLSVTDALPLLVRARQQASAHPATRCWGAAALHALHLVARGRILPGLTADGHDAWRAGPSDAEDVAHLRAV